MSRYIRRQTCSLSRRFLFKCELFLYFVFPNNQHSILHVYKHHLYITYILLMSHMPCMRYAIRLYTGLHSRYMHCTGTYIYHQRKPITSESFANLIAATVTSLRINQSTRHKQMCNRRIAIPAYMNGFVSMRGPKPQSPFDIIEYILLRLMWHCFSESILGIFRYGVINNSQQRWTSFNCSLHDDFSGLSTSIRGRSARGKRTRKGVIILLQHCCSRFTLRQCYFFSAVMNWLC